MKTLLEQHILLSALTLHEDFCYLSEIQRHIRKHAEYNPPVATIHKTLVRLVKNKLLKFKLAAKEKKRGGRRKVIYRITSFGYQDLKNSLATTRRLEDLAPIS